MSVPKLLLTIILFPVRLALLVLSGLLYLAGQISEWAFRLLGGLFLAGAAAGNIIGGMPPKMTIIYVILGVAAFAAPAAIVILAVGIAALQDRLRF